MGEQKHQRRAKPPQTWTAWFETSGWPTDAGVLSNLSTTTIFWILVGAAFAVRTVVLLQLSNSHPAFDQPIVDSRWHYLWAQKIAAGDWLGEGVFYRAPLYPYLLALWMKIFGDGIWPIRLMQAFVGGVTAGLTFMIGEKSFGRRVGLIAGLAAVSYGTLIYYETELLIEVIAVPLGLWAVYLAMDESSATTQRSIRWLGTGVIVGLFAIARPNILLVVPAFWWWAWPSRSAIPLAGGLSRIKMPLILTLGVLIPVIPVTIRNYVVAQDAVLISYQGGVNLWLGNNPQADGLTMQMPEVTLDESVEWDEFVRTTDSTASALAGRTLHASEVSTFWTDRAVDWMLENPVETVTGWIRKTWYFLGGFEVSDQTDIYAFSKFSSLLNILISRPLIYIPFGLIAPFAILGLVLAWRRSPQTRPLVGFVILYAFTVILFLATARHRLPVVPIFVVCAAAAVVQFGRMFSTRGIVAVALPALLVIALMIGLNQRTVERIMTNPAFLHYQMALSHERSGDYEGAALEYEAALKVEPNHLASRKNLAYALVRMGAYDSAVALSFSYLRHRQEDAEAYNNIGLAYLGLGDTSRAAGSFRTAVRYNPKLPQPYLNLADIASTQGDNGAAVGYYRSAIDADSTFAAAYSGLAIRYTASNNMAEAEALLRTGLRKSPDHPILQANMGSLLLRLGRTEEAIPHLERAVHWQPHVAAVRINLAVAYLRLQRLNAAQEQLRQVMVVDPTNETAKKLIEQLESMGGNL